tara:strand:- start:49722 stop:50474 length:753 start_codon:yes stop_codon:yes gene_type:complete
METLPPDHPRYISLLMRDRLISGIKDGITSQHGLIAHGRGESFDYLLSEKTLPSANKAAKSAASHLALAKNPVISVNGNTAALVPAEIVELSKLTGASIEVNLFHRTEKRINKIISHLNSYGATNVKGISATSTIPGISHERAKVTESGLYSADVVIVPLEDGDRVGAFTSMGKIVVVIDLNPLSRSSQLATVPIVDNVSRAIPNIIHHFKNISNLSPEELLTLTTTFNRDATLEDAERIIRNGFLDLYQ